MDEQAELFLGQLESIEALANGSGNFHPNEDLVTSQDHDGNTLLHVVAERGMAKAIEFLLHNKIWKGLVNKKNKRGEAPLHILCQNCQELRREQGQDKIKRILKALLDNGADINVVDGNGWTPLHYSIEQESLFMVDEILATNKVDVNKPTISQGATPLHMAVNRNLLAIVRSLLVKKADRKLVTHSGESILQWALSAATAFEPQEEDEGLRIDNEIVDYGDNYERVTNDEYTPGQNSNADQGVNVDDMGDKETMDTIIEELLKDQNKWHQLLQVACTPVFPKKWLGLHRIWMAMKEDRFNDLKSELENDVQRIRNIQDTRVESCKSWNVLELSTYLDIPQLVTWLLRSKRWTQAEKERAMSLLDYDTDLINRGSRLESSAPIWSEPFVKYNGTGRKKYDDLPERPTSGDLSNHFRASVVDIFSNGTRFSFSCYSTKAQELLYSQQRSPGLKASMGRMAENLCNIVPGFDKSTYGNSSSRFRWIHFPANCIQWMIDAALFTYLEEGKKQDEITKRFQFLENSWHELPEIETEEKYMHPNCSRRSSSVSESRQDAIGVDKTTSQLALYVSGDSQCEDLKLPFHPSRTLDTYYRGKSREATERDKDQVFSRYVERERSLRNLTAQPSDPEILHVGQLWLWVADDDTIITGTSHHPQAGADSIFEAILNRLSDSDEGFNREAVLASMNSFVEFIFSFYINIVDNLALNIDLTKDSNGDSRQEFERVSIDTMFTSSIEEVSRTESSLRSKFQKHILSAPSKPASDESQDIHEAISVATGALTEIKDIRGELKMIRSVVRTQQRVWNQMLGQSVGYGQDYDDKEKFNSRKSTDPKYVLDKIESLLEFAEETEKNVTSVLELHMNQLSLHEAETSRKQREALMVFTVVTVIFTPLSFVTSLFALNISVFPHMGDNVRYEPGWIFGILGKRLVSISGREDNIY
ncbi:hypothetical protein GQX73_g2087 [Xylaria multiplex]|uniref:Uncharacterized protein n=1 Tax=Xylaria multiplex TaxID=323545 RepID=A0A7C8ISW2_9PEZI|nr:hypothetical protein GQX73_g2087 [Xylaria multiplex]